MKLNAATLAYTFDDVTLAPVHSKIKSRKDPNVSVNLPALKVKIPVISSPMNTITEYAMSDTMLGLGGAAVLHRYMSVESQVEIASKIVKRCHVGQNLFEFGANSLSNFFVAVGANGDVEERVGRLLDAGVTSFCVDVANGHSDHCLDAVRLIKRLSENTKVMAGNVATFDGASNLADVGTDLIRVGIGAGCFAAGTRILMSNGSYKNIEDVQAGNRIINKNGDPVTVKNILCTGRKKVKSYRHTQFYKKTFCTEDHLHWTINFDNKGSGYIKKCGGYAKVSKKEKFKWEKIESINTILSIPNKINFELSDWFNIKLPKRISGSNKKNIKYTTDTTLVPSYNLGYIFGTFLGDGNAHCVEYKNSKRGSITWTFGKNEIKIAKKLCLAIQNTINKSAKINEKKNIILVNLYYKPLADFMNSFGKKVNKKLPEKLIIKNKLYLQGLYGGLMDSDGHICYSDTGFTNTSPFLIELFSVINYMLYGTIPNMYEKKKSSGNLKNCDYKKLNQPYRIQILKTAKKRINDNLQLIKMLENTNEMIEVPVYDIEVECPTHSFIANNAIVHNSICTTRLVTGHGVPQLTAIEDCVRIKAFHSDIVIVADGGVRSSGDAVKALAVGADIIMLGGLLSGSSDTPGETISGPNDTLYKHYFGMASKEGRESWFERSKTSFVPEGVATTVPYKGNTSTIVEGLVGGLKVGMSYAGAFNLEDLRKNAKWVRVSGAGMIEGTPHGKK